MYQLALALGKTAGELQAVMTAREFSEWIAFNNVSPFGRERDDIGHAITASTIANVFRGKNKRSYKVSDFMPDFRRGGRQSLSAMKANFAAFKRAVMKRKG